MTEPGTRGVAPASPAITTHAAALCYARRGWPVFPCHGAPAGRCGCGRTGCTSPGKHPLTRRGLHDATTRRDVIDRWWRRWPHANVAIRTGAVSRLVVLDVDPDHGGIASLREVEREHGALPITRTVRTGSGGLHLYYAHPREEIRNQASTRLGPGIDVRGDGGYVIAPPSLHASGAAYQWHPTRHVAALPAWLAETLTPASIPEPPDVGRVRGDHGVTQWARAALTGELTRIAAAQPGQRNHTLNRAAFALGQLVGGGHLDYDQSAYLLVQAGLGVGLGGRETRATVASGLAAGARHPRYPADRTFRPTSVSREAIGR